MTVMVECIADGCEQPVERGGGWSETRSTYCDKWDRHVHTHCPGSFDLVGMESQRLRCLCHCHRSVGDGPTRKGGLGGAVSATGDASPALPLFARKDRPS